MTDDYKAREARELEDIVEQLRRAVAEVKAGNENKIDFVKSVSSSKSQELNSEKGNKFDAKLILESKEKREAAHAKAIERRIEREMEACTFKPALNRKSIEIAAEKGHKFTPIAERRSKEPLTPAEASPTPPMINANSRAIAERKERSGPVHDRLLMLVAERQQKIDAQAAEQARRELDAVTGTPQIDRRSHEILRRKILDGQVRLHSPHLPFHRFNLLSAFANKLLINSVSLSHLSSQQTLQTPMDRHSRLLSIACPQSRRRHFQRCHSDTEHLFGVPARRLRQGRHLKKGSGSRKRRKGAPRAH